MFFSKLWQKILNSDLPELQINQKKCLFLHQWHHSCPLMDYPELKKHIEANILPQYAHFDAAHRLDHADAVIAASLRYARSCGADEQMAYVIAAYHDVGLSEGREVHHLASARILLSDEVLRRWFSEEQLRVMAEAVEDHRASATHPPRSIYGRIVAEADRQIDADTVIRRTVQYGLTHYPDMSREEHFERMCAHLREKYGDGGYLKLWINDSDNARKLEDLRKIIRNEDILHRKFEEIMAESTGLLQPL